VQACGEAVVEVGECELRCGAARSAAMGHVLVVAGDRDACAVEAFGEGRDSDVHQRTKSGRGASLQAVAAGFTGHFFAGVVFACPRAPAA
jgi:hypothetical protein